MAGDELDRLRTEYDGLDTVEARVEHTSRMLTEMTRSVGIAAAIPQASPALDQIELVGAARQPGLNGGGDARLTRCATGC